MTIIIDPSKANNLWIKRKLKSLSIRFTNNIAIKKVRAIYIKFYEYKSVFILINYTPPAITHNKPDYDFNDHNSLIYKPNKLNKYI